MNNCSDKERPPVGGSGGRLVTEQLFGSLGRFRSMRRSRPDPEQLFRRAARPRKGPATCCKSSRASRGGIPRSYPDPEARCQPRPRSRTIFRKPRCNARSPRMVRAMGFSGLYAILNCILWVIFNNHYIWCCIHHS